MSMTTRRLKVLLVDDATNVTGQIVRMARKFGLNWEVEHVFPNDAEDEYGGCRLPSGAACDQYDLALVDLELFPIQDYLNPTPSDLLGGTKVLPYLRQNAPWLPVIGYSQHFVRTAALNASERFMPIACGFGFDGYVPRGLFDWQSLTLPLLEMILSRAVTRRDCSILGEEFAQVSRPPSIDIHPKLREQLCRNFCGWEEVLGRLFYFASNLVVEKLQGGWSGASVLMVFAKGNDLTGGKEGQWLVKISTSPSKLWEEAKAHVRLMRAGLDFARSVQLLWNAPIVNERVAGIAYQFAKGTNEAAKLIKDGVDPSDCCQQIGVVLESFYSSSVSRKIVGSVLEKWGPSPASLRKAAEQIGAGPIPQLLNSIAQQDDHLLTKSSLELHEGLIHGDLHLGNIMLGSPSVLIDFARAGEGAAGVDIGRLAADFFVRVEKLRGDSLSIRPQSESAFSSVFKAILSKLNFNDDDIKLADLMTLVFLAQHLNYEDIAIEDKEWIRSTLARAPAPIWT